MLLNPDLRSAAEGGLADPLQGDRRGIAEQEWGAQVLLSFCLMPPPLFYHRVVVVFFGICGIVHLEQVSPYSFGEVFSS